MIRLRLPNEILKEIDFVYMSYYNFEKLLSINNTSTRIHYYRPIKSRGKFTVYFFASFKLFCKCPRGATNSHGE